MVWSFSNLGLDRLQKNRNEIAKRISKCLTELLRSFKASTHSFNQIDQYTYASLMFSYHVKNAVLHLQLNLSKKIYTKKYAPHTMENIRYAQTKYLYFKKWTLAILSFNSFPKHMQMHIFKYTRKFIFFQLTAYPVCKKTYCMYRLCTNEDTFFACKIKIIQGHCKHKQPTVFQGIIVRIMRIWRKF